MPRVVAILLLLGVASPASACIEFIPDHPDVLAKAHQMFDGVVQSRSPQVGTRSEDDQWVLMVKVTRQIKGWSGSYAFIRSTECSVPPFPVGTPVTAFRFADYGYMVVRQRSSVANGR